VNDAAEVDRLRNQVLEALTEAGYRRLQSPLRIGDIALDLDTVWSGPDDRLDLVAVFDQPGTRHETLRLYWQIQRVARALDAIASRRSISAILLGGTADRNLVADLQTLARVLPVDGSLSVRRQIAPLLDLNLPEATQSTLDGVAHVRATVNGRYEIELLDILAAAPMGAEVVERRFAAWVDEAFKRPIRRRGPRG
jgi:hypothetical protein